MLITICIDFIWHGQLGFHIFRIHRYISAGPFPSALFDHRRISDVDDAMLNRPGLSCFQPRPRRRIAAPRFRRWTPSRGTRTTHRYRDLSSSYPARWNPSRGGTNSHHLSSHLPLTRARPPLAAAHGAPFQGKEVAVARTGTPRILLRRESLACGTHARFKSELRARRFGPDRTPTITHRAKSQELFSI